MLIQYCAGKKSRTRWARHVALMGERKGLYSILVGENDGMKSFLRLRGRWEDNSRMDLQELGSDIMDWIELDQDRKRCWALANVVMNLRVTSNAGNF